MRIKLLILWTLFSINVAAQNVWTDFAADYQILDIATDGDYIWCATQGGLVKTHIKTGQKEIFQTDNSILKENYINRISIGYDGSIWVSTLHTSLYQIKGNTWYYYPEVQKTEFGSIEKIVPMINGDVWILSDNKSNISYEHSILRLRNGALSEYKIPVNMGDKRIYSFDMKDENNFYVLSYSGNLLEFDLLSNQVKEVSLTGLPIDYMQYLDEISTDKYGNLFVSRESGSYIFNGTLWKKLSDKGVFAHKSFRDLNGNLYLNNSTAEGYKTRFLMYDGENLTFFDEKNLPKCPPSYAQTQFQLYAVDPNGVFFGSNYSSAPREKIVFKMENNKWSTIDTDILPMSSNFLSKVITDCDNNVWFSGGVGVVDELKSNGEWKSFDIYDIHSTSYFISRDIEVNPIDCSVWICNGGNNSNLNNLPGLINIKNDSVIYHLSGSSNIFDVEIDDKGTLYVFHYNHGLGEYKNDLWKWHDKGNFQRVSKIESDNTGNVYLACGNDGLHVLKNGVITFLGYSEIPGATQVNNIYVDNDGFLWVSTNAGLAQYNGSSWKRFDHVFDKSINISGIEQDKYGNFWISTSQKGLHYWDRNSIIKFTRENSGISSNNIRSVHIADDGYIWLATSLTGAIRYLKGYDVNVYNARGTVYFDKDKSGTRNLNEIGIPNQKVELVENANISITNGQGVYTHYIPYDNSYNFKLNGQELFYSTTTDHLTALITQNTNGLDFGVFSDQLPEKVELYLNSTPIICESDFKLYATIINESLQPIIGKLNIHSNIEYDSSNIWFHLWHQNNLAFPIDTILPLSTKSYTLRMIGPSIDSVGQKVLISGSFMTNNQTVNAKIEETLLCSYDPNDKLAYPTGIYDKETSLLKDDIRYVIRFQNEGNYFAKDIIILDTLDQSFDLSTFKFTGSSHACDVNITRNGVVSFIFKDIKLTYKDDDEIASQGYVSYTIKAKADTPENSILHNKAHIFFDANDGIVTNTTQNKVVEMFLSQTDDNSISKVISIFPSPSFNLITVTINENIDEINIRDISGRMMFVDVDVKDQNQAKFDISAYSNGMYIIELIDVFGNRYLSMFIKI